VPLLALSHYWKVYVQSFSVGLMLDFVPELTIGAAFSITFTQRNNIKSGIVQIPMNYVRLG